MKKQTLAVLAATVALACSAHAQFGRMNGPAFNSAIAKLFGDNTAFTADIDFQTINPSGQPASMPGKIAFDNGKSRFEMSLADAKGGSLSPGVVEHMKTMGLDKTVVISRPDTKTSYLAYPSLSAYAGTPLQDPDASKPESAFKIQTTELGRETVNGHACIKNKVVITDDQGKSTESTVWNAIDLKKFPVKIEKNDSGRNSTILFNNVKLSTPDKALFEPPSDYKKYDNQQALLQQEVMKRMQGMTMPPGHP